MKANKRNPLLWMSLPATTALLLAWLFFFVAAGAQAGSPQLLGNSLGVADGPAAPTAPSAVGPADLFFSEYIEGSSNNKALEIYNGTGAEITFSGHYTVA
ncbi:MAG: hypothetical protein JXA78_16985, partial [Anaerolineales bacterium]|nr:hypothetical protein [Anaerolineales bacterium]